MIEDPVSGISTLNALRDLEISLAIDDFGTGYSSLSYLKKLPINRLKIAMASNLGLSVIAEGVENVEQINFLLEQGCNEAQGFYYSKPVTGADLEALLELNKINKVHSLG